MSDAKEQQQQAAAETTEEVSLLDQIVDQGRFGSEEAGQARGRGIVSRFVSEVLEGTISYAADTENMINARIADIDRVISAQLNEIMHNEQFQDLEARWRGMQYLLQNSETGTGLKLKILNVEKKDLLKDLQRAMEFDQSALFKKVYEEEYGVFGGAPFAALLGDYSFSAGAQDVDLLKRVSQVAAAAHAPFLTGADVNMFGLEDYTQLDQPRDMAKIFDSTEYARWNQFRQTDDSRYVAMTLPRMLIRDPYGDENPIEAFDFQEDVDGTTHGKYLWANAAWGLATRVTSAYAQHGWCATIRGVEGGGLLEGLPVHNFRTDSGDIAMKCPTEVQITDRREKELADLGFVPLVHAKGTANAAFFSVQSAQRPKEYSSPSASANARLSSQLPYIFAVSRFAHYLKSMMRDKIGSYMERSEAESFLNNWIADYVVGNDDASADVKAKRPLREARIDVTEIPGKPGAYRAVAFLRPHFQLEELNVSMRLVADLPAPAN